MTRYLDMDRVRRHAESVGSHWFSPGALRFFRSRIAQYGFLTDDGSRVFFVSSEQFVGSNGYRAPRRYSVRVADMTGSDAGCVDTVGEFQAYETRSSASAAARGACDRYNAQEGAPQA